MLVIWFFIAFTGPSTNVIGLKKMYIAIKIVLLSILMAIGRNKKNRQISIDSYFI